MGAVACAGITEIDEKLEIRRIKMVDEIDLLLHFRLVSMLTRLRNKRKFIFLTAVIPEG